MFFSTVRKVREQDLVNWLIKDENIGNDQGGWCCGSQVTPALSRKGWGGAWDTSIRRTDTGQWVGEIQANVASGTNRGVGRAAKSGSLTNGHWYVHETQEHDSDRRSRTVEQYKSF